MSESPVELQCSGSHPSCTRCLQKGYACEYRGNNDSSTRRQSDARGKRERSARATDPEKVAVLAPESDTSSCTQPDEGSCLLMLELSSMDQDADSFDLHMSYTDSHCDDIDHQSPATAEYDYQRTARASPQPATVGNCYDQVPYYHTLMMSRFCLQYPQQTHYVATHHHIVADSIHAPMPVRGISYTPFLGALDPMCPSARYFDSQRIHMGEDVVIDFFTRSRTSPQIALGQVPPVPPLEAPVEADVR